VNRTAIALGALAASALLPRAAQAIPSWARKYNMPCSGCHYPAPPKLNALGIRFRWAGYRLPNEMGQDVAVDQVSNYLAAQGQVVYTLSRTGSEPAAAPLSSGDAKLWYMGPLGKHFVGWFEFERMPDATMGLGATVGGVWGNEHAYGGFRVGQGHFLFETGVAGFERNVALTDTPLPMEGPTTAGVPFVFSDDRAGAEAFYVTGNNRLSVQVLEPVAGVSAAANRRKDYVLMDQFLLDQSGGGLQLSAIYGSVLGVDSSALALHSTYWRIGCSASHYFGSLELLAGLALAQDNDLPTGGTSPFTSGSMKGSGWWLSGEYAVGQSPLAIYGRYEAANANTSVSGNTASRVVLGGALPLTVPQYLRVNVEYSLLTPQTGAKTNNLAAALTLAF
jgi:hypothetical protein